jgi:hypothetical protein
MCRVRVAVRPQDQEGKRGVLSSLPLPRTHLTLALVTHTNDKRDVDILLRVHSLQMDGQERLKASSDRFILHSCSVSARVVAVANSLLWSAMLPTLPAM